MGSGDKCNQTGCENPAAFRYTWPGQDETGICREHAQKLQEVAVALGCPIRMIPIQESADPPDPEAVKCKNEILCVIEKSNELHEDECTAIISRYLQKARGECDAMRLDLEEALTRIDKFEASGRDTREDDSKRLVAECDALKASNSELRDQLCANTKLISELQHTVRLVQETHSQHVHECAVKAFQALEDAKWLDHDRRSATEHKDNIVRIICEAFGAPAKKTGIKDEFEEWYKATGFWPSDYQGKGLIREGFMAAWKLAKADNKGFAGQGPDIDQIKLKLRMDEITKEQWHGKGGK